MTEHPRVYTDVQHHGAYIIVAGTAWVIDSVDVHPVLPGCEPDATAHLSLAPDPPGREPEADDPSPLLGQITGKGLGPGCGPHGGEADPGDPMARRV